MNEAFFEGKTFGDIIDDDTQFPSHETREEVVNQEIQHPRIKRAGNVSVITDINDTILVFVDGKPKALFGIYEFHGLIISIDRSFVLVYGHEHIHIYWLNDGGFDTIHTR